MICSKCGTDNNINNAICIKCGQELKKENNSSTEEKKDNYTTDEIREINTTEVQNNINIPSENQNILPQNNVNMPSENQNTSPQNNLVDTSVNDIDKKAKKLGIISLLLYFGVPVLVQVLSLLFAFLPEQFAVFYLLIISLSGYCPMAGLITMIVGRVKYPNNSFLKIVMWIIIASIVIGIVIAVWVIVSCSSMDLGSFG